VGGEWHQDQIIADPDSSNLIGTNNGSPFVGSRSVTSEYVELDLPVLKRYLELQVAARHEAYSDFGGTTKAKFAFGSQLTSFFKLRGSYSQSFKAPDLAQLDGGGISFSAATTRSPESTVASQKYEQLVHSQSEPAARTGKDGLLWRDLRSRPGGQGPELHGRLHPISRSTTRLFRSWSFTPAQLFTYFPKLVVRQSEQQPDFLLRSHPLQRHGLLTYRGSIFAASNTPWRNTPAG